MRPTLKVSCVLFLGVSFSGSAVSAEWAIEKVSPSYLGTLGGANSFAHDVNDHGDIVGWSDSGTYGVEHAFILRNGGSMEDLADILGVAPNRAYGINNHREVVGALLGPPTPYVKHVQALYWSPDGVLQGIHKKPSNWSQWQWENTSGPTWSVAYAINNSGGISGEVCCRYVNSGSEALWWPHAFTVPSGISSLGSSAYDANESNHVVGRVVNSAYLYRISDTVVFPQKYLPTEAHGVNDKDGVVGWYRTNSNLQRAFFWDAVTGVWEPLGLLPTGNQSIAYKVNSLEFAAGWANVAAQQPETYRKAAFIWHRSFGIVELPAPASTQNGLLTNCEARSLNNRNVGRGVIRVVGACTVLGTTRGVRWDVTVKPKQNIEVGPAPVIGPPRASP